MVETGNEPGDLMSDNKHKWAAADALGKTKFKRLRDLVFRLQHSKRGLDPEELSELKELRAEYDTLAEQALCAEEQRAENDVFDPSYLDNQLKKSAEKHKTDTIWMDFFRANRLLIDNARNREILLGWTQSQNFPLSVPALRAAESHMRSHLSWMTPLELGFTEALSRTPNTK
jgi:hypothetical protein